MVMIVLRRKGWMDFRLVGRSEWDCGAHNLYFETIERIALHTFIFIMFRSSSLLLALFAVLMAASVTTAFTPTPNKISMIGRDTTRVFAEPKKDDDDKIPEGIAQGPEEGQIPGKENAKKGAKTMESLANQGNTEGNKDES